MFWSGVLLLLTVDLCTAHLRWLAAGDTGCDCPIQHKVASAMGDLGDAEGIHFAVNLGDAFYHTHEGTEGIVGDARDHRFYSTFENVYIAPSLKNTTWYVMMGNHDQASNKSAWIGHQYYSKRWYYPSNYYTRVIPIPHSGDNATVQIVVIDSALILALHDGQPHGLPVNDPKERNAYVAKAHKHLQWLEEVLSSSKADWIVVMGHHHIYSGGQYGGFPHLLRTVPPLLEKYGVVSYMNGHDHSMQHNVVNGVNYFVNGNGGLNVCSDKYRRQLPQGSHKFYLCMGGFADTILTADEFYMQFRDTTGASKYSYKQGNPRVAKGLVKPKQPLPGAPPKGPFYNYLMPSSDSEPLQNSTAQPAPAPPAKPLSEKEKDERIKYLEEILKKANISLN